MCGKECQYVIISDDSDSYRFCSESCRESYHREIVEASYEIMECFDYEEEDN
jgi:endogenous inhibitor of DNA gyrase (YacG/DUF329 family)